ncbi:hypothetical protein LOK49_LG08G00197 [Camellia lanceoleosa]|uniref:Uncharacterized protein n=1 Tax=Camellia lanceoleosa TaxID=1840588 RepID=A0ACC0GRU9_9ERIC|nr:hypothetical protein LOK49_LG08G00197 [Camellia lanceoleosa]
MSCLFKAPIASLFREYCSSIKLSDASKNLGKKFATGASVVKGPTENEQIDVQGDIFMDIVEFITETWPDFDVTFPALPCSILSLDAMDISGEQHLDVKHDIVKKRLDTHGNVIEERQDGIGAPKIEKPLQRHGGRLEHNETYCGSCYGAEVSDDDCCNSCDEVRELYRKKGWALSNPDSIDQRNNDCKGGIMEQWHQKLHNNTSSDDVVIFQALIDFINNDFDVSIYWKTLNDNGITKECLLSYDREICSEPNFRRDRKDGLLRDLRNYIRTLKEPIHVTQLVRKTAFVMQGFT